MPETRTIETPASSDLATQTIIINGTELERTYQIMSVSVGVEVDRIPFAKIVLLDGEAAQSDFKASNTDLFIPGNEIEILSGYHSDEAPIFKGIIVKHSLKVRSSGSAMLIVECRHKAFKMALARKSKYYYNMSDSEIIEDLLGDHDFSPSVEATAISHAEMVQYDMSDWDFLLSRAEVSGLMCFPDLDELAVKPPDLNQGTEITLEYGATILEFDGEMDGRNQYATVATKAWDKATQEVIEVEADEADLPLNGNLSATDLAKSTGSVKYTMLQGGNASQEEIQAWADARLLRSRIAKTRGRVKFQGVSNIVPGMLIELRGLGDRFNGPAFVSGVFHGITDGRWTTDVQFGIDPEWLTKKFNLTQRFDDLLPGIRGLQIGKVVQIEDDPEGEDRIQVKLPMIDANEEGVWARLSCLDAGKERGTFFRPEENDEVIVGFVNNDLRNPIVLGMLNSSAHPTPNPISKDNNEKGYTSRSQLKLLFNDEDKSVSIETPGGKKIILDEKDGSITMEDENKNKVLLNSDGITLESGADLNIKAQGDINIEGVNITAKAKASFKSDGGAGAELTSSATVTVKGSLVQIN